MQRTRAIPVAWLGSGSCPNWPKGWIIIIIIIIIMLHMESKKKTVLFKGLKETVFTTESNKGYTGCPRRNVQYFGRVFRMLNYTDITQNTYSQSWTVTEIMAREVWNFDSCYTLIDYQIHIETDRNMWYLMLISVLNIKVTCEWHKAIKLNYKNTRSTAAGVLEFQALCISAVIKCYLIALGGACSP